MYASPLKEASGKGVGVAAGTAVEMAVGVGVRASAATPLIRANATTLRQQRIAFLVIPILITSL
jgi:hypothetical protein